jgi:hypothetical protein
MTTTGAFICLLLIIWGKHTEDHGRRVNVYLTP